MLGKPQGDRSFGETKAKIGERNDSSTPKQKLNLAVLHFSCSLCISYRLAKGVEGF